MKGRWRWVLLTANLLALVGLAFAHPAAMVSPGPVVAAHAAIASECFACHAPFRGAAPARCETCHALADIGVRTTAGARLREPPGRPAFHQQLNEQDCIACHAGHADATRAMLGQRSKKPFSHELLRVATRERCEGCHEAPAGGAHPSVSGACQQCHDVARWKPARFEHDSYFELDRDHAVACVTCHTENVFTRYTCFGCHEHTPSHVRADHAEEGIRNIDDCASCHKSPRGEPGEGPAHGEREH